MYVKYFKLKEEPFSTTPDPRFLYRSEIHQEALERLMTGIASKRGINAIVAEPGLGKSTLIRTLLNGLSKKVNFAWVFNTSLESKDLVKFICRDFGFKPKGAEMSDILMELYAFLVKEYERGNTPLLIIDEAQNLKPHVLEEIRQLSNLETMQSKLLQIILSGQPQLDVNLDQPDMQQLKQRICLKAVITRLDLDDTMKYVRHRLQVAGNKNNNLFTDSSLKLVKRISDGVPRLINQICDNAMMTAARRNLQQIDAGLITELFERGLIMAAGPAPSVSRANYTAMKERVMSENNHGAQGNTGIAAQQNPPVVAKPKLTKIVETISGEFGGIDLHRLSIN
ncbi:MAG TPA: AAA family ATPase [bacterium]|nr:AAA family ATPase [bacterium]HPN42423.1 AAA family ATPase [bacterium]